MNQSQPGLFGCRYLHMTLRDKPPTRLPDASYYSSHCIDDFNVQRTTLRQFLKGKYTEHDIQ
ncbi:hypothetical protein C8Q75DRAFT_745032 [Abortiporus biennis]|nr:hypothetical protein C8Q75DRAFT_745032 [Abortiporus biennis]